MPSHVVRGSWPRRALAVAGSAVLMVGAGVVAAPAALAADPDTSASHAFAQYLSVTGGPSTGGAIADYTGNGTETPGAPNEQSNALASLVSTIPGLEISGSFGSEFAHAGTGGASWSASGMVTGAGGVGAAAPANVDIDLGALLAAAGLPNTIVEKMQLSLQEVGSIAKLDVAALGSNALADDCGADWNTASNCRDYTLKSGSLHIESDALKGVMAQIQTLAGQIDAAIGTVTTTLPDAIADALVAPANAALSSALVGNHIGPSILTGGHKHEITAASLADPQVSLSINGTVLATVTSILAASHTVHGVTLNLGAGTIDVDFDTFMGGLNDLDPNTPLFGSAVTASVTDSINDIISDIADEIAAAVPSLLQAVNVTMTVSAEPTVTVTDTKYKWKPTGLFSGHWEVDGAPTNTTISGLGVSGTYTGTLWDVLNGGGTAALSLTNWPVWLDALGFHAPSIGAVTLPGLPGGISSTVINSAKTAAVAAVQGVVDPAVAGVMGVLNSASSVFGGTINAQSGDATTGYQVSALELRFGSAAPLRSGSAFKAAPRPGAIAMPSATIRLATSIVGPNRDALTCAKGTHYDPKTGTCVKDSTPGGGVPGGGVPGGGTPTTVTTSPTTTTTPTTEVLGTGDTVAPVSPSVEVAGESSEVTETTEVAGLAETGPRELGVITLLGLELLLGGIAFMRLTTRRRRAAHNQHHV